MKFLVLRNRAGKHMMTDPIADFLTRIRNAGAVRKEQILVPHSKMKHAIADLMKSTGYIENVERIDDGKKANLKITLKYRGKNSVITGIKRVSKPGLRVYVDKDTIPFVLNGIGISILSTSTGLLTGKEARKKKVGGELICEIW